jgi:preprotein translocase subunit YajC
MDFKTLVMNITKAITFLIVLIIISIVYFFANDMKSFIELLLIGVFSGLVVEFFFWRKQRKKGAKDLIDLIVSLFKKSP